MAKLTLTDITSAYDSITALNDNFAAIEAAMEKTLFRDGTIPNEMNASLDMNSNRILNLPDAVAQQEPITLAQAGNIAGVSVPLTQENIGSTLWPQTASELAAGITPTNYYYPPGNVQRYGGVFDGTTDDTQAFQDAVDSGWAAYTDHGGTTNIAGTITIDGFKSLYVLNPELQIEKNSGTSTAPMLHIYGNQNVVDLGGATIRNVTQANPHGIILIGPSVNETEGGTTDVQCYGNMVRNFKMVGPENGSNPQDDGAPGVYIHSIRRKKFTVGNPTYDTKIKNARIVNCDVGIEFSTDANRSVLSDIAITQYKTGAVYMNAAYGNQIYGLAMESPLNWSGGSPRYAIHLMSQNSGTETGTDPTYAITQAYNNYIYGYSEFTSGKGRLINWDAPTTLGGYNVLKGPYSASDGFGKDGTTNLSGLGNNVVEANTFYAAPGKLHKLADYRFEETTDGTGTILNKGSICHAFIRKAAMDEGTHYNVLEVDNVGGSGASIDDALLIEINYAAKASENSHTHSGKMLWSCAVENNVALTPVLLYHFTDYRNEDPIVQPWVTASAGTAANTGKFTISIENVDVPAVTSSNYCSLDIKLQTSTLAGTTLDWDADVSFLDTTYATAANTIATTKLVDHLGNGQIANRQANIAEYTLVTTETADGTYDATEQSMLNNLKTDVTAIRDNQDLIIQALEAHGLTVP